MAKLEAHDEIIETMVDYSRGLRNKKTAPIELARLSGLDLDVAKALLKGQTIRTATELRGYSRANAQKHIPHPKKKVT
jgi:hypothetical protein